MKKIFLKEALKKTKFKVITIIILSLLNSYLTAQIPLYIKYALDGVVYNNEISMSNYISIFIKDNNLSTKLIVICIFLFTINIFKSLVNFFRNKIVSKFKVQINKNVREKILAKTEKIRYLNFFEIDKNKVIQRTTVDINTFISFFDVELIMLFDLVFVIIFAIKNTFNLNYAIGIYFSIIILLLITASIIYFKKSKHITEETVKANEELIFLENNLIKNIRMIKMYGKEEEEKRKFLDKSKIYNRKKEKMLKGTVFYHIFSHILNISSVPIVVTIGGIFIATKQLSFGDLAAILQYRGDILEKCSKLEEKYREINQFYIAYKNLEKFINLPEDAEKDQCKLEGNIILKNVSIYINNNIILKNLNLVLKQGKKYVLVGDNGAGKSVLLKTILGMYEYTGEIFIGDKNLKDINSRTIINEVCLVNQENYLFNTSILENITFGKVGKNDSKFLNVLKISQLYNELPKFNKRVNTIINENSNLSGGQKQRIAIARALYQDKKYLLFDDTFNKLDYITKNKILDNLTKIEKTIIVATHDYQVIQKFENVLLVKNKKVILLTNSEVTKKNDYYKKIIDISKNKLGEEYE